MEEKGPQFDNFKDAFCAYYRVKPDNYAQAVLWRSLPLTRKWLALPILAFNRTFFATDLDIIRNLAPIQSSENFSLQLDELHTVNRLERNIRRGFLGIRTSGAKLMALWKTVEPYIAPPAVVPITNSATSSPSAPTAVPRRIPETEPSRSSIAVQRNVRQDQDATGERAPSSTPFETRESSVVLLRRVKRACDDIVAGVPEVEAITKAGLDGTAQFRHLLEHHSSAYPSFQWLLNQFRNIETLRELERENAELKSVLAQQSIELARLRSNQREGPDKQQNERSAA